ncbi:MAG: hypothetical protein LBT03_01285, partial [Holosporales bacterium]|nr:hypothetical protein [Holosporales bacterium]
MNVKMKALLATTLLSCSVYASDSDSSSYMSSDTCRTMDLVEQTKREMRELLEKERRRRAESEEAYRLLEIARQEEDARMEAQMTIAPEPSPPEPNTNDSAIAQPPPHEPTSDASFDDSVREQPLEIVETDESSDSEEIVSGLKTML